MRLYNLVKSVLETNPATRSDDKLLLWETMKVMGLIKVFSLSYESFCKAPAMESINRARRQIQGLHPELQANETVKKYRHSIEKQKGTHVFREEVWIDPMK